MASPTACDDRLDGLLVLRLAGEGAVQIDQMQAARALLDPMLRHRRRVLGKHGGIFHGALLQAHAVPVFEINGRNDQHAADRENADGSGATVWIGQGCRSKDHHVVQKHHTTVACGCEKALAVPFQAPMPGHLRRRGGPRWCSAVPVHEVGQQPQPRRLALFRVELHGEQIALRHGAGKRERIDAVAGDQSAIARHRIVAVHEVEAAACGNALPQRVRQRLVHFVPSHVRHLELLAVGIEHAVRQESALTRPSKQTEPGHIALLAHVEQHLQADADAQERLAARRSSTAGRNPRASSSRMQSGIAPWPGKHHAPRGTHFAGSLRHRHAQTGRDVLDRLRTPSADCPCRSRRLRYRSCSHDRSNAFGASQAPLVEGTSLHARIELDRHAQRPPEGLECGLGLVVRVRALQIVDVQRDQRVIDEALEEFVNQIDVELADQRARELDVEFEPRRPDRSITTRDSASSSGT